MGPNVPCAKVQDGFLPVLIPTHCSEVIVSTFFYKSVVVLSVMQEYFGNLALGSFTTCLFIYLPQYPQHQFGVSGELLIPLTNESS